MYKWPRQSGRLYCKTRVSSFVNLKTGKMDWYFLVINIAPKYNDIVWRVVEMTFLKDYFDGLFSPKLVCVYVNKTGQPISVGCQWYMIIDRVFAWLSFVFRCSLACFRGRLCRLIFIPIFLFFLDDLRSLAELDRPTLTHRVVTVGLVIWTYRRFSHTSLSHRVDWEFPISISYRRIITPFKPLIAKCHWISAPAYHWPCITGEVKFRPR